MDFWAHQDKARRHTKLLVFYYALTVVLLIAAIYLVIALVAPVAFSSMERNRRSQSQIHLRLWNPELLFWVTGGTLAVVALGSAYKIVELSGGGSKVAIMLGGRPLNPVTQDPDERRLMNVIEEMAIASGMPVPEVYILEDERSINAFAAGTTLDNAAIGVTRGCMKLLNRSELQGVMAHEFSHILNGDMRLNIRLIGILNGILCLAILGRILLYVRGGRGKNSAAPVLIGLALLILGSIGLLFGRLIKAAVSRQREFLADASAVQFTRNPDSIAGALKKIGGLSYGSRLAAAAAEEASHMFFGDGVFKGWNGMFSTHPPLTERIKAIEPSFDGKFPEVHFPEAERPSQRKAEKRRPAFGGRPPSGAPPLFELVGAAAAHEAIKVQPRQIIDRVAAPARVHLDYASELLESLPDEIREAARQPFSACALIYTLLLSPEKSMREEQLRLLKQRCLLPVVVETKSLLNTVSSLKPAARLPLVDLTLPVLRQLSNDQFESFSQTMRLIIESDRQISLFEYALERIVRRRLTPAFRKVKTDSIRYLSITPLLGDCEVVLSGLAHVGQDDRQKAQAAFQLGADQLSPQRREFKLLDFSASNLPEIDKALDRIAQASPPIKKRIMNALVHTVAADNEVRPREAELLRAIADTLGCPIPPFVEINSPQSPATAA